MLAQMQHDNNVANIDLLYANRDQNFVFGEELKQIAATHPTFKLTEFVDKRIEEEDLQSYFQDDSTVFYLSGPRPMVEAYEEQLKSKVGEDRVKTDYFPGY
jgi:ferredoxin-NADP reductase